jgi:Ca2+-transporting ATPase
MPQGQAVTVSFLTLAFAQLGHVLNMRGPRAGLLDNEITRNPFVWGALVLCTLLLVAVVHLPALAAVLSLEPPGTQGWLLVAGFATLPVLVGPLLQGGRAP